MTDAARRSRVNTDQLGDTVTYTFDMANRLLSRDYRTKANSPSGTIADTDSFTYDKASRLLTADSGRYSNTVTLTYNDDSTLDTESLTVGGQTYTVEHGYDADDRRTSLKHPDGALVTRTYTDRDQLDEVAYDADGSGPGLATSVASFTYDPGKRESRRDLGNGLIRSTSYRDDANGEDNLIAGITTETAPGSNDRQGLSFSYTYDANKNVTGETTGGVMASYTWTAGQDAEDRLIDWDSNTGEERDWDLTLVGDWDEFTRDEDGQQGPLLPIVQPRNHTDAHEVDDIDGTPADHDPKGNMTDDGAVTGGGLGGSRTFAWDFDNRLTSVTMPDGKVHRFTYDALGRRVSKRVDLGSKRSVETVYVCATHESGLGQVVAEYIKGDAASSPQKHFVYGRYVDDP